MVSYRARALFAAADALPDAVVRTLFTRPPRLPGGPVGPWLRRRYDVVERRVSGGGGGLVATVRPKHARAIGHVVFLHGGAYTLQPFHWPLLRRFVDRGCAVSLVDYPLAPEHTVDDTVPMVVDAYKVLRTAATTADEPLWLVGDSAGGGLALVLLQQLRDLDEGLPVRTALLSPWVDLEMTDAATVAHAERDPLLSFRGLEGAARLYAGGHHLRDPRLSPLFGDLAGLGEVRTWVSTDELFLPQCRRLAELAADAPGTDHSLEVVEGMVHDWGLFPVPERARLVDDVLTYLTLGPERP